MHSDKPSFGASLLKPMALIPLIVALVSALVAGGSAMAWHSASAVTEELKVEQVALAEAIMVREREIAEAKAGAERLARAEAECAAVNYDRRETLRFDVYTVPFEVRKNMETEVCPDVFRWIKDGGLLAWDMLDTLKVNCDWRSGYTYHHNGTLTNTSDTWTVDVRLEARLETRKGTFLDGEDKEYLSVAPGETIRWSSDLDGKKHDKVTCWIRGATFSVWPSDF